jgi:hypothetical protein
MLREVAIETWPKTTHSCSSRRGGTASLVRTLTNKDIELFAVMSGDMNSAHVDEALAKIDVFIKLSPTAYGATR